MFLWTLPLNCLMLAYMFHQWVQIEKASAWLISSNNSAVCVMSASEGDSSTSFVVEEYRGIFLIKQWKITII